MHTKRGRPSRRAFISGMATALSAPAIIGPSIFSRARAQQRWPQSAVRLIVPYGPGGATDLLARPWAEKLGNAFGEPFVVENRGGASGTIGAEAAARSSPDGLTFLFTPNSALNVVPQLRKVGYDVTKDLMPVARVGDIVGGFVIHPKHGLKTMAEVIAYAKRNPGKLSFASAGLGTSTHMRIEMLKLRAGIDILHVPYRGSGDALNDVLAGNTDMMNEIVVYPHVKAGKLNLLAINHPTRHWDFPNAPTMTEAGFPGCDVPIWFSVWAPTGTSPHAINALNRKIIEIAKTEEMINRMRDISMVVPTQTPEEVGKFFAADTAANAKVIQEAGIKLS